MGALLDLGRRVIQQRIFQRLVRQLFQQRLLACQLIEQRLHIQLCAGLQQLQRICLLLRACFQQLQRICLLLRACFQQLQRLLACQLIEQRLLACEQLFQRLVLIERSPDRIIERIGTRRSYLRVDRLVALPNPFSALKRIPCETRYTIFSIRHWLHCS